MCARIKAQYGNPFLCDFIDWLKYIVKKTIKGENWNKCQWYSWSGFYDFNATIGQNSLDVLQTVYWLCVWSQIHIRL